MLCGEECKVSVSGKLKLFIQQSLRRGNCITIIVILVCLDFMLHGSRCITCYDKPIWFDRNLCWILCMNIYRMLNFDTVHFLGGFVVPWPCFYISRYRKEEFCVLYASVDVYAEWTHWIYCVVKTDEHRFFPPPLQILCVTKVTVYNCVVLIMLKQFHFRTVLLSLQRRPDMVKLGLQVSIGF
jgi:hypothetical protein